MIDDILKFGSGFNWITPAIAFIQDLANGPARHFGIPALAVLDKRDIKRLLTKHGVRVWGLMYNLDMDTLMFSVPEAQAKWTYYLLQRENIPVLYAPSEVVNSSTHRSRSSPTHATKRNPKTEIRLESLFNFLDKLHNEL